MGLVAVFLSNKLHSTQGLKVIVKSLKVKNFRSFEDSPEISLANINVLIGANNTGKSSIIRALSHLQDGVDNTFADIRTGSTSSDIHIKFEDTTLPPPFETSNYKTHSLIIQLTSNDRRNGNISSALLSSNGTQRDSIFRTQNQDPKHLIVPFFSKRKTANYTENVSEQYVNQIASDMSNLAARLSRIANPSFPAYQQYEKTCREILGFVVTSITSLNGQKPGVYQPDNSTIPIEQMGEGVPNIVSLLMSLATSEGKIFLIEEPENDLHPQALKSLLDLIAISSQKNQFVISTHSNIVVTHLCSREKSKLFKITSEKGKLPIKASIEEVDNNPTSRIQVLQELGYSFSDYDLWEGWLLLEESSAERIIRDYLIPWFAPKLSRIKTVSASGINNVEPMFNDLYRMVLFTHLQQAYSGLAWARVDGDEIGKESIQRLKEKFPSIPPENFSTFEQPQFEHYYPNEFKDMAANALATQSKKERQTEKTKLLKEVISWIEQDQKRAKEAFKYSASNVISELQLIEQQFIKKTYSTQIGQQCPTQHTRTPAQTQPNNAKPHLNF